MFFADTLIRKKFLTNRLDVISPSDKSQLVQGMVLTVLSQLPL
jgi:hypothetical protein